MQQTQTMTLDEKLSISNRAFEMMEAGDREGGMRLMKTAPMPHYVAKVIKDKLGLDFLLNSGWNLSDAEAEYGSEWLRR